MGVWACSEGCGEGGDKGKGTRGEGRGVAGAREGRAWEGVWLRRI